MEKMKQYINENETILNCSNNQLTSLPTEIGMLPNLKYLYCNNNQLTSLPTEIGMLSNLHDLYCYNNQLTSLPTEIGMLSKLVHLNCNNNLLTVYLTIEELRKLYNLRQSINARKIQLYYRSNKSKFISYYKRIYLRDVVLS